MIPAMAIAEISFEESEGCTVEAISLPGWTGEFVVNHDQAHIGAQSLRVVTQASTVSGESEPVVYADFWIKASADDSANPDALVDFDGAVVALLKDGDNGVIQAFDASGDGKTVPVLESFPLDDSGSSASWIRVTIRRDGTSRKWDLFCNGRPVAWGLGLESPPSGPTNLRFSAPPSGTLFVDDIEISSANPLFIDKDNDGLPDAYEVSHGMNAHGDDRSGDADLDGSSNIVEFFRSGGVDAQSEGGGTSEAKVLYVDNALGNDSNTGRYSYSVDGDGPKASIHAAMDVAGEGSTIAVMEGIYNEGEISLVGKPFNLITVGKVKF